METKIQKIMFGAAQIEKYYKTINIKPNTPKYTDLFATLYEYHTEGRATNPELNEILLRFTEIIRIEEKLTRLLETPLSDTEKSLLVEGRTAIKNNKDLLSREFMYIVYQNNTCNN